MIYSLLISKAAEGRTTIEAENGALHSRHEQRWIVKSTLGNGMAAPTSMDTSIRTKVTSQSTLTELAGHVTSSPS